MEPDAARRRLDELIRTSASDSYASVSALIGRNHAYIQQYIKRGLPRRLHEDDRRRIAAHFGVPEWELGGPRPGQSAAPEGPGRVVWIPAYGIDASAGAGSLVDSENVSEFLPFRMSLLRSLTAAPQDQLAVLGVTGDSMYPTLADGDDILVDRSETHPHRDAIYVIRFDDVLQVKRVSVHPTSGRLTIKSDNPLYHTWNDCDPEAVGILGRVVWVGRRL